MPPAGLIFLSQFSAFYALRGLCRLHPGFVAISVFLPTSGICFVHTTCTSLSAYIWGWLSSWQCLHPGIVAYIWGVLPTPTVYCIHSWFIAYIHVLSPTSMFYRLHTGFLPSTGVCCLHQSGVGCLVGNTYILALSPTFRVCCLHPCFIA